MSDPNEAFNPNHDLIVNDSPSDSVSSLRWHGSSRKLVASSWSGELSVFDFTSSSAAAATGPSAATSESDQPQSCVITSDFPFLSASFLEDATQVVGGSCDNRVLLWNTTSQSLAEIGSHDAPVKEVNFSSDRQMIVSAGWDSAAKFWDARVAGSGSCHLVTVPLPERAVALDVRFNTCAIAVANRRVVIFDLRNLTRPLAEQESTLRLPSRSISLFPDAKGYALGSIEGRVAIMYINADDAHKNFAFKCHRDNEKPQKVFSVNAIAFHPGYETFATCGSDGSYTTWDHLSRSRLRPFFASNQPITAASFSHDGGLFAYSLGCLCYLRLIIPSLTIEPCDCFLQMIGPKASMDTLLRDGRQCWSTLLRLMRCSAKTDEVQCEVSMINCAVIVRQSFVVRMLQPRILGNPPDFQ